MIWWYKGRRLTAVVLPGLLAFALLAAVAHGESVALPGLIGTGGNLLFLMHITPLIVTGTLAHSLAQRLPEAEDLTVRPLPLYDVALALGTVAAALSAAVTIGALADSSTAYEAGRNTLFLTGLMLLGGAVHPQAATVAPVAWVFVAAFVGYRDFHRPWPWAVTLHPAGYLPTFLFCLAVFLCGLVALRHTRRRPTS
ncbi:hypothetical protein [Streptomyces tanashiensis]|uniref:ABC transporter permease n=1 Tax=Streptomyces tanashiensis TaxID=67367 RepID=A0ABY6R0K1_9ACTN|nr:hypothetical protein [Streptomyces tanashiensis]UZX23447.1 hypothetical protein LDH80_23200 [Streptomyces tanashiensis]